MLWVYGHCKYFHSYSVGIDFSRQNLSTEVDPRAVSVNSDPTKLFFLLFFNHLRLCLATAIHNFQWLEMTHLCVQFKTKH